MKTVTSLQALLLAGALTACGNGDDVPPPASDDAGTERAASDTTDTAETDADWQASIAGLQALADETFSLSDQLEADLAPINDALPDLVSISWDEKSLDATNGATVFSGLTVTINSDPAFGMTAEEAEVWGLNSDLISARLRGERLDETGLAFNRLEARNVSYFGVAGALGTLFDAVEEEVQDETGESLEFSIDTFESTVSQMVMSNVSLRPYEIAPISDSFFIDLGIAEEDMTPEEQEEMAMATSIARLAQQVVAVTRSLSIEDLAAYDTTAAFSMTQAGMEQSINVSWDFYGYEDLVGFDLGRAVVVNSVQSQNMVMSDPSGEMSEAGFDELAFDQVETIAFMEYNDIAFDKLAGFLARAEFPGMDERDLLSLGTFQARDYSLMLNGGDVFEADRVAIDADSFAWFIPEALNFEMTGAQIGVQEVGEIALSFFPAEMVEEMAEDDTPPAAEVEPADPEADAPEPETEDGEAGDDTQAAEAEEFKANLQAAVDKLGDHDLADIPFDVSANWTWDAVSGGTGLSFQSDSEGFGEGVVSLNITLPDYDAIQAAFESDDREMAFEEAFRQAFAFNGARFFEADDGGYDKLFGYVSDIATLYPDQGWAAMLGGMTPEEIRNFMATMIRSGKQPASQQFPPAEAWLESVAAYYATTGGSLEIKAEPPAPLTPEDMESFGPGTPPEQIVEELGLSVTHSAE